jgi:hypothetical protein
MEKMTRAKIIIDRASKDVFCQQYLFNEVASTVRDYEDEKKKIEQLGMRARMLGRTVRSGLQKEKLKFEELWKKNATDPELQEAFKKDSANINGIVANIKSKGQKLKSLFRSGRNKNIQEELEYLFEDVLSDIEEINEGKRDLLSFQVIRTMRMPTNTAEVLRGLLIGFFGTQLVLVANTVLISALVGTFGPVGYAAAAIFIAPLTEETYKVVSLHLSKTGYRKTSELPAFYLAVMEFVSYAQKILASPGGILSVGLSLLMRAYIVEFHMTTTRMYQNDIERYGRVRIKTLMKGMGWHAFSNFTATIGLLAKTFTFLLPVSIISRFTIPLDAIIASLFRKEIDIEKREAEIEYTRRRRRSI